jgi:hypothetical protein
MPKTFHEIRRWDGGLSTYFDEGDIEATELSAISLWSVSKPGQIYSLDRGAAQFSTYYLDLDDGDSPLGAGFLIFDADYGYEATVDGEGAAGATRYAVVVNAKGNVFLIEDFVSGVPGEAFAVGDNFYILGTIHGDHATEIDSKCRLFWAEGALRISDTLHTANSRVKWFGRVVYERFNSTSSGHEYNSVDKWVFDNADLSPPTIQTPADVPALESSHPDGDPVTHLAEDATNATPFGCVVPIECYPSGADRGKALNLRFTATTGQDDGGWEATEYEFAQTFVYQGNQESMPVLMPVVPVGFDGTDPDLMETTFTIASQQYFTNLQVYACTSNGGTNDGVDVSSYVYPDRVTGARIYIRKYNANKRWTLFLDCDFTRGVRQNTFEDFSVGWVAGHNHLLTHGRDWEYKTSSSSATGLADIKNPSPQTYESINGYAPDGASVSFDTATQGWEDATVINRRCFAVGVKYINTESGNTELMSDRVFYSAIGKYDTFPVTNWIDIGINDGESFKAVAGFANRLFAFKETTLYIINVQNPNDGGWFLETELKGMGVSNPNSVVKTDQGLVFANVYGLYIFTGQGVPVDVSAKIDKSSWKSDLTAASHEIAVGYDGVSEQVMIALSSTSGMKQPSSDGQPFHIYDLKTKSFVRHTNSFADSVTNFSNMPDTGLLVWGTSKYGASADDIIAFEQYQFNTLGGDLLNNDDLYSYFTTGLIDFGSPALMKKFYKLYIEVKGSGSYILGVTVNGVVLSPRATHYSESIVASNTSYEKKVVDLTSIPNSSTFQLRIDQNSSAAESITINSISLEYRTLYKRVS